MVTLNICLNYDENSLMMMFCISDKEKSFFNKVIPKYLCCFQVKTGFNCVDRSSLQPFSVDFLLTHMSKSAPLSWNAPLIFFIFHGHGDFQVESTINSLFIINNSLDLYTGYTVSSMGLNPYTYNT